MKTGILLYHQYEEWNKGYHQRNPWMDDPRFGDYHIGPIASPRDPPPDWPWYAWCAHALAAGAQMPGGMGMAEMPSGGKFFSMRQFSTLNEVERRALIGYRSHLLDMAKANAAAGKADLAALQWQRYEELDEIIKGNGEISYGFVMQLIDD